MLNHTVASVGTTCNAAPIHPFGHQGHDTHTEAGQNTGVSFPKNENLLFFFFWYGKKIYLLWENSVSIQKREKGDVPLDCTDIIILGTPCQGVCAFTQMGSYFFMLCYFFFLLFIWR